MEQRPRIHRRSLTNLLIDSAIFVAFLAATAPQLTGIAIHEWLSIAFGAAVITHLLLHWEWIAGVTIKFFRRATHESRINYILNVLLFIDITIVIVTGLLISEAALPLFGVRFPRDGTWRVLHRLTSDGGVVLLGLHIALHWRWIISTLGRLVGRAWPVHRPATEPVAQHIAQEVHR